MSCPLASVAVEALAAQLAQVEALGKRTASQHDNLMQAQTQIDAMRLELAEFHRAHAEAAQLRDRLAVDRVALDRSASARRRCWAAHPSSKRASMRCWASWHWSMRATSRRRS